MDVEDDDDLLNCSYEEDNPSETSSVSLNSSALRNIDASESDIDSDNLDESLLNVSFSSTVSDNVTSTPTKRATRSQTAGDALASSTPKKQKKGNAKKGKKESNNNLSKTSPFKIPKVPPVYLAKCARCCAQLKTFAQVASHNLAHTWKDLASKIPTEEEIISHAQDRAQKVLESMVKEDWDQHFKALCAGIYDKLDSNEWKVFLEKVMDIVVKGVHGVDINKRPLTFAATSRKFLITHINASLNEKDIRDDLLEKLLNVYLCQSQVAFPFLTTFIRRLGNSVLANIFSLMSERDPLSKQGSCRSKDDFDSLKCQRVVHYVAGSCMRGIIRHAYNHPNSAKLQRRKMCVLRRFGCIGEPIGAQKNDKAHWTGLLNRKSLFFVKDEVLPFFVDFAKLVQSLELPDGSVYHERVMQSVVGSPYILQRWCDIIDADLDDDESIDLLIKVARALTNTFARGILLRRQNQRSKKGKANKSTASASHRAKLL